MDGFQQMGRLALREEGDNWNAYYAMPGTMEGAIWLGSIKMAIATRTPERKKAFMDLMREGVADLIEDNFGTRPTWGGEHTAPAHEKATRA